MLYTKKDLVDQLVEIKHYTKASATQLIDDFVDIINFNLRNGDGVQIRKFGTFKLLWRAPRTRPDFDRSLERVHVPGHYIPRFYAAEEMKRLVREFELDQIDKQSKFGVLPDYGLVEEDE